MPTSVTTPTAWFDKTFGAPSPVPDTIYRHFEVRVIVPFAMPYRHPEFDWLRDFGMGDTIRIINKQPIEPEPLIVFPERHLSVQEQYWFMSAANQNPSAKRLKLLRLVTSSPVLLSSFTRHMIRIVHWPDEEPLYGPVRLEALFGKQA